MKDIEKSIIPFVESQFPAFYKEEGEDFIAFVKAYYEWLEQDGNVLQHTRSFYNYVDVDKTVTDFLTNFKSKYLTNFPTSNLITPVDSTTSNAENTASSTTFVVDNTSKRILTKKAVDLYRAKGNENALNLLFRLLFKESVNVYLPSSDVLKPSQGRWIVAKYLELSITEKNKQMVGQTITGLTSRATATVEKISRRMSAGTLMDVAYLTNIKGNFLYDEIVTHDGLAVGSPTTLGSVTNIIIDNEGSGFEVGQIVDVISNLSGRYATARVIRTGSQTGKITYSNPPIDGGYGYTLDSQVFVSSNVLFFDNKIARDSGYNNFFQFETVTQPLANIPFTAASNTYANGMFVYGIDASVSPNTVVSGGVVLKMAQNTSTDEGWLLTTHYKIANVSIGSIVNPNTSGSFVVGEVVYQVNSVSSTNSAVGYVLAADALYTVINTTDGTFQNNRTIIGAQSNCTANAIALQTYNEPFTNDSITHIITPSYDVISIVNGVIVDKTASGKVVGANNNAVGLYDVDAANPFVNSIGNYIVGGLTNVVANVGLISQGDPGGFDIGSLTDTETIFISTDFIADNNIFDEAYLTLDIDTESFGFPKLPSGNVSTVIEACLSRDSLEIGSIASLTNINPGSNNTARPFVRVYEKPIAMHDRRNFTLVLANTSKPFVIGEPIVQSFPDGALTMSVTSVVGSFNAAGRELIQQVRSDGATVSGVVIEKDIAAGSGTIRVRVANTSNTFDTSNTILGINSTATATVTSVTQNNYFSLAKGTVIVANATSMDVKRRTFGASFIRDVDIVGAVSGATAQVRAVYQIPNSLVIGNNAIIGVDAGVLTGTLKEVEVLDSGMGYYDLEPVDIKHPDNPIIATGYVVMGNEGKTGGFYRDTGGFLSADKKIQDSKYYQEFSYEVQSSLSLDKYATILKETLQVAGTKLFGKVVKTSNVAMDITTYDAKQVAKIAVAGNSSTGFAVGETLRGVNNAIGIVDSYVSNIVLDGSNNEFVIGTRIAQPSFQLNRASGDIETVSYDIVANTTLVTLSNIDGIFDTSANVQSTFNRKFVEYTLEEGTLINGEIVYQSNGTANVGVGDLVSSISNRLVIKPLTEIYISSKQGTLTSGDAVFQRTDGATNTATGVIFSANNTHVLVGNTRGEFTPGYKLLTATGNASITRLGGKKDDFTVTDKVFLAIDTLSTANFANGEIVIQKDTGASGTITFANTSQLRVESVSGVFQADAVVEGGTSNTTANVISVSGPFKIIGVTSGAIANSVTIESPYTNVSLGVITTINTLTLSNVQGNYVISTAVEGNTTGATANITSIEVVVDR